MTGRDRFYRLPNRIGSMLEAGTITVYDVALIVWVGSKYEGTFGGFLTTKQTIAHVLDGCAMKTVQRSLKRTRELELIAHDLRQGQRTPFTIKLGPAALVDTATLDSAEGGRVQGHFGQGVDAEETQAQAASGVGASRTLDSRARKGLSEEVVEVGSRGTRKREVAT